MLLRVFAPARGRKLNRLQGFVRAHLSSSALGSEATASAGGAARANPSVIESFYTASRFAGQHGALIGIVGGTVAALYAGGASVIKLQGKVKTELAEKKGQLDTELATKKGEMDTALVEKDKELLKVKEELSVELAKVKAELSVELAKVKAELGVARADVNTVIAQKETAAALRHVDLITHSDYEKFRDELSKRGAAPPPVVSAPGAGVSAPAAGVSAPAAGVSAPAAGVSAPAAGVSAPGDGSS